MKNVYFAEFNRDGERQCGSDSVYVLDGRNTIDNMREDAKDRIYKLRFVQRYNGFKICYGTFCDFKVLSVMKGI